MRGSLFFAATLAFASLIASSSGCSSETGASGDRICTPGANVFCRCADREPGTKECSADGTSFAPCTTGVPGECKGEIQDPDTGKPVDDGGNPILNDGGTTNIADKCPGKAFAVEPTKPTAISGDTTAATDAAKGQGSCAVGDQAKDEIYKLTPSGSGTLTVEVQGKNGFSPNVYLRTVCDDEASQAACNPQGSAQGLVKLTRRVTKGTPIYLVVDGKGADGAGAYDVTASLVTGSFCGDGEVDPGEACDDGNNTPGDGCGSGCRTVEGNPASGGTCPGQPVHVWPGQTVTGTGGNNDPTYGNAFDRPGSSCTAGVGTNPASDHVYEVTAHKTGQLIVKTTNADYNVQIIARKVCASTADADMLGCANLNGSAAPRDEELRVNVTDGQKVYVALTGVLNGEGTYTVSFQIP